MIEVAIPTRARAETLCAKTLPLLLRLGVAPSSISIFAAPEEHGDYLTALGRTFPAPIVAKLRLAKGAVGMAAQRHAILHAYESGARVVSIDDDIRDLSVRAGDQTLLPLTADEWVSLVDDLYKICDRVGSRLWGLYPVANAYFMKPRIRTDLSYVGGGCFGVINDPSPDSPLRVTLEDKEDFERSLACYETDGAVVRCDYVTWQTEGYAGAGGMQADGTRSSDRIRASADTLVRRFPDLCSLNLTKKSRKAELRLRDRRPTVGQATLPT
jgi:hypothetical protein